MTLGEEIFGALVAAFRNGGGVLYLPGDEFHAEPTSSPYEGLAPIGTLSGQSIDGRLSGPTAPPKS